MAYDVELADRVRAQLSGVPGVVEKRMFGGLAFLLGTRLAVSASREGGLLVRVGPDQREALLSDPRTRSFVMRGRETPGWLQVDVNGSVTEEELGSWVGLGIATARSLPPR